MALTPGNTKLGALIWGWSIPAMRAICVGATELCASLCYAMRGFFLMPSVSKSHKQNYEMSLQKEFPEYMGLEISRIFARVVRLHVSGDFYSVAYVRKWLRIVRRRPHVTFYAYTRSWRESKFMPVLEELAALPNFFLFYSCDAETGEPPESDYARRAYLMTSDEDVAPYHVDLNFRNKAQTVMKFDREGRLICPYENGVTSTTCSKCKLCFTDCKMPQQKQLVELTV